MKHWPEILLVVVSLAAIWIVGASLADLPADDCVTFDSRGNVIPAPGRCPPRDRALEIVLTAPPRPCSVVVIEQ
jgi:hypothetical protein